MTAWGPTPVAVSTYNEPSFSQQEVVLGDR